MLHRLGQALRTWARAAPAADGAEAGARDGDDPPEQWLRYVRERAPGFELGKRRAPVSAGRAAQPAAHSPMRAPAAISTAVAGAPVSTPAAPLRAPAQSRPLLRRAPEVRHTSEPSPVGAKRPRLEPRENVVRAPVVTPRAAPPTAQSAAPQPEPEPAPPAARATRARSIATPISVSQPVRAASETPRPRDVRPAPESKPWASLPPSMLGVGAGDGVTPVPWMARDDTAVSPTVREAGTDDESPPPALAASYAEADDGGNWADLPEKGFEAWHLQSSRLLLREQLHLARLMAEQGGFSWSGPHS